jgi:hypothetical protein
MVHFLGVIKQGIQLLGTLCPACFIGISLSVSWPQAAFRIENPISLLSGSINRSSEYVKGGWAQNSGRQARKPGRKLRSAGNPADLSSWEW